MNRFLAFPKGTATWMLTKPAILDAINALTASPDSIDLLKAHSVVEGSLRLAADDTGELLAIWNADYLSGRPDEPWGFIALDAEMGIAAVPEIRREVLERTIYVVSQRMQGLLLDGSLIHRAHPNGVHTCLAGRGSLARQWSVGYVENDVRHGAFTVHTVVVCGPVQRFDHLVQMTVELKGRSKELCDGVLSCVLEARRFLPAVGAVVEAFRESTKGYSGSKGETADDASSLTLSRQDIDQKWVFRTSGWSYDRWMNPENSPLTVAQRRILDAFPLDRHPVRITGPAGSGKTLVMQLLALRYLERGTPELQPARILYVAHNAAMATSVRHRFDVLIGTNATLSERAALLETRTLSEYGLLELELDAEDVIDRDAAGAKEFQLEVLEAALQVVTDAHAPEIIGDDAPFFSLLRSNSEFTRAGLPLLMTEISSAIKGQGITVDRQRYVLSERPLSRLHGILGELDRQLIFATFQEYEKVIRETYGVLDADDVALSLLNKLQAPVWELRRRKTGYDYVFVDETQLFNENERRVLPLLTRGSDAHVPIALSLDEAQDLHGNAYAGLATLGFTDIQNENLWSVQRSTHGIVQLAFFVISQTTDLFSADFPDFTKAAKSIIPDTAPLAREPLAELQMNKTVRLGDMCAGVATRMRKEGCRTVAIVCHADQYWQSLQEALRRAHAPYQELLTRGAKVSDFDGITLTRPSFVGGQEFDAVLVVGLELGTYPPPVANNSALRSAVEQQALREVYLSVSRARYQVVFPLNYGAQPNALLSAAKAAGYLTFSFAK